MNFHALVFPYLLALPIGPMIGSQDVSPEIRKTEPDTAYQWEVFDVRFSARKPIANPVDIEFFATFEHSSGKRLKAPGFYDSKLNYIVRFTPPQSGEWQYQTTSNVDELNKLQGKIVVTAPRKGRRGGILVDEKNKTQFRFENGESYYPIAFESDWLFALDAENPRDIPITRKFIDYLADNGFNQIIMNVFAFDVNWQKDARLDPKFDFGSPKVFPFGGNNQNPDHSQINIEYFKRLDRVIDYLDQKGIAAHLMIYVWNKNVSWPKADSPEDNRYFDYVVKRYQAFPNVIWDISKEALGYGHNDVNYITERIRRLRKLDQYDRLVTVHDYTYCRRFTHEIDFVSVQLWLSELYGVMRKVRSDMPDKPILNIEHGGYERGPYTVFNGNYTSPEVCLERAWQCVFAGTFPTHYWQGAAWNVIIPDVDSLKPEEKPRLQYYRHMRTIVDRYKIDRLISGEKKSNAGFCLHNGKNQFIFYVPKECEFIGLRLKEFRGKMMTATWFDPRLGKFGRPIKQQIPQWPTLKSPGGGFQLLIIEISSGDPSQ